MKFFKPLVQLAKELQVDAPTLYYAHVVTFCPRTSFCANGYEVGQRELNSNGIYDVLIKIKQDPDIADMEFITPVVHTIDLGEISFPDGEGWIRVSIEADVFEGTELERKTGPTTTTKTGGSNSQSTAEAANKMRPIDDESLV